MKPVPAVALALIAGCSSQRLQVVDVQQPTTAPTQAPARSLDVEQAFISVGKSWYQDLFGCVRADDDKHERLILQSSWDSASDLRVLISSTHQSGVSLDLRFRFDDNRLMECTAKGSWHYDFGSKPEDFNGTLDDVSGVARVYLDKDSNLRCLFVIRGVVSRSHKPGDPPSLLMGGFEIPLADRPQKR